MLCFKCMDPIAGINKQEDKAMKKLSVFMLALALCVVMSGCCCGKSKAACDKTKECPKTKKCVKTGKTCPRDKNCPKAKSKKCEFAGMWNIYVLKGDKLEGLPVSPQPRMELFACGKMTFHYAKDGKAMSADGKWQKVGNNIVISSMDGKRTQKFTINAADELQLIVGKGDAVPEKTTLILKK